MARSAVSPLLVAALLLALTPESHTANAGSGGSNQTNPAPAWLDQVQRDIAEQEYEVSWQGAPVVREIEPAWQAPNRAHGFRTYFTAEGIRVVPRTGTAPSWRWGLSLVGYGRGDDETAAVPKAGLVPAGRRVEYRRGALMEFYENSAAGLEQGFVLPAPPPEARPGRGSSPDTAEGVDARAVPAHVDLALWGDLTPRLAEDGQAIDFVTSSGAPAVHYAQLEVTDARGSVLSSHMEGFVGAVSGGIRLVFDDRDAVYPVTIDPVATSPAWTVQGDQANGYLGAAAATAGDVNGDGYSDVIVGADGYDVGGVDRGQAYLYLGSASGLSPTPSWTVTGAQQNGAFGGSAATAGDVNGDGYSDVIVGARGYTNGEASEGAAYLYLGSAAGLSQGHAWIAEGGLADAGFGSQVATAGDVNGDGFSDVIVGAGEYTNFQFREGRAWVYLGSSSGLASTPVWSVESNQTFGLFGTAVSTAGDVNGDGYAEIIVGAWGIDANGIEESGRAYLYLGSASGPSAGAAWIVSGAAIGEYVGSSVGTAGDVNGDGFADVIVGAPGYANGEHAEGRVSVYLGAASGLATTPAWSAEGNVYTARLGAAVSTAGDVNGDGFADVIVAAPSQTGFYLNAGRVSIYLGSALGLAATPVWTVDGDQNMGVPFGFGSQLGPAGDVNGDGYADVIVASSRYDTPAADAGKAFVYLGSPGGPATAPGWTTSGGQLSAYFGFSVGTAGDVNGDGFADVIVGAFQYDNGETDEGSAYVYLGSAVGLVTTPAWTAEGNQASALFGYSVGSAGDVNGDGFSDIIVGAHLHDNGETDEGRAYVYLGSAAGVAATPAWTGEGNQAGARFGYQVATAGDIDGDGYDEIIVGAPRYDAGQTDEGRVYIYRGFSTGPSTFPRTLESNQAGAQYGIAVASAGDVNRDGFADVLIGAELFDNGQNNEGRAYLHLGSAAGLNVTPAWFAENNEPSSFMGSAVASAGDVNGDGYSDVLVGARGHDGIWSDQGLAYLYQGTPAGLALAPAWTMEIVQDGTGLGTALGTAGDVNGDGFADVIVGASQYDGVIGDAGAAFLYLGAASGLATAPAWTQEGVFGSAYGSSVGTAGDVNGDGYADIIVGGPSFSSATLFFEGKAFVYYGNGGAGLSLRPRQRRFDNIVPIDTGGRSRAAKFRLAAAGRTPFGRGRVRLEWEVKPLGQAFDGSGLARTAVSLDTGAGAAGVPLNELVTGLQPVSYHWRLRLLYEAPASPFAQRSRWLTMPWNGWNETDLIVTVRLGGVVWADLDHDGIREPGEPPVFSSLVSLLSSTDQVVEQTVTSEDGHYDLEVRLPGSYRIRFQPTCYGMTTQDQGADDSLDSDADGTGRTGLIGPTFAEGDDTRWSGGLVGAFGLDPIRQPVVITGAHQVNPAVAGLMLEVADPNPPVNVSGYNVYFSTNPALPLEAWEEIWTDHGDEDPGTPGVQLTVYGDPAVGSASFFQVTAYNSFCGIEGPR
jgi:hypothetical protein